MRSTILFLAVASTDPCTSSKEPINSADSASPEDTAECCKVCGEESQPCGDTCISEAFECHTPDGCAC